MPKVVDVLQRREALVAAVLSVVQEQGAQAVTVRAIAQRAGVSAGLVHHYFPEGKAALLHAAVSASVQRGVDRMLAVLDDARGLAAVRAVAHELLPVTDQRRSEWSAWVALWRQVLAEEPLRREQAERLEAWRALLQTLLQQAVDDGELPAGTDPVSAALRLAATLDGLGLHALVDPGLVTPAVMTQQVDAFLDGLGS